MKRKRRVTGRFITQKSLPKANPTLEEIAKGQIDYDVISTNKDYSKSEDSPYWQYVKNHTKNYFANDIKEMPEANPDVLGFQEVAIDEQPSYTFTVEQVMSMVLTPKQANMLELYLKGYSQELIAKRYKISQQTVNQQINAAKKKLRDYFAKYPVKRT